MHIKLLHSCLILCDSMDCSLPDSSVHRNLQARIRSGLPFPLLGDLADPEIKPTSPALAGGFYQLCYLGSLGYAIILRKNWKLTSLKLTLEPTSYLIGLS